MEQRINFAGIPVDVLTAQSLAEALGKLVDSGRLGQLACTLNAEGLFRAKEDPRFAEALLAADLIHADGMPIVWLSPLFGRKLPEKLTTTDVVHPIAQHAARKGHSFYFLGARPGVAEQAAAVLAARHPGLQILGTHHGYFQGGAEEEMVIREINRLRPDVLWVGLGRPRQELWAMRNRNRLQVPVIKTCGGLFDFISGQVPRGPKWMTDNGLEWVYRLFTEPRRLWRRYLIGNVKFLWYVLRFKLFGY
jgi:N-acetylglucosaminyldiphosphoundecaprenol N-acetyl-beta-D-mannosaminyltransferase